MSHMLTRSTRPAQPARPAPTGEVAQCRGLPAADAGQRHLAERARQAQPGGGSGLPDGLRHGIEGLSGLSMDDVRVHRNSAQPERMGALAFAQGRDIHLGPGQEHHLPHEAWHVVQQAQGRVAATRQHAGGTAINDDPALEREAEAMGEAAMGASASAKPVVQQRAQSGPSVIQRVGGTKVAVRIDPEVKPEDPLLPPLLKVFGDYKQEIRTKKGQAKTKFQGKEDDYGAQTEFATALRAAEMDVEVLKQRLADTKHFKVSAKGVIRRKEQPESLKGQSAVIGTIVQGNDAFEKTASKADAIVHDIYSKLNPAAKDGRKVGSEYIQVKGRMLRRYAYRGITPLEIAQIEAGGDVKPLFNTPVDRSAAQSGMHFKEGTGKRRRRAHDKLDLSYLRGFSNVTSVTPAMYGFVHGRKGVGKFFSLRSTPGDITSNHGASFSDFGEVKIDLAQVAEDDFVFHYADGGGDALTSGIPDSAIAPTQRGKHDEELKRARESVVRNREVILKAYPAAAASWVRKHNIQATDMETRGYNDFMANRKKPDFVLYETDYDQGRARGQAEKDYNLGFGHGTADKADGLRFGPDHRDNSDYMRGYRAAYNAK